MGVKRPVMDEQCDEGYLLDRKLLLLPFRQDSMSETMSCRVHLVICDPPPNAVNKVGLQEEGEGSGFFFNNHTFYTGASHFML